MFSVEGNLVDLFADRIYPARISVNGRLIQKIEPIRSAPDHFILPGFVDAHVHIESSMLTPCEFARQAVLFGTIGTVSDPHEIANVLGLEGVQFMLENAKGVPFKFAFGAPSCVPATAFETAGARLDLEEVRELLQSPDIYYLSEMMNYPGVIHRDPMVMSKLKAAKDLKKPIDGHAPGLRGEELKHYLSAGIETDHECFQLDEALEKIAGGMKILIREGSAAKNFEALSTIIRDYPDRAMLCCDDQHPHDLIRGHINRHCARAVAKGYPLFSVLRAASHNPVNHYRLPIGLLREGDPADFIVTKELKEFEVLNTYIDGELVADHGKTTIASKTAKVLNRWKKREIRADEFSVKAEGSKIRAIEVYDGQIVTGERIVPALVNKGFAESDCDNDLVKLAVVNRYQEAPVANAFVVGTGLKRGAIASSVAHDSHNFVILGCNSDLMARATKLLMEEGGGIVATDGKDELLLPLPVAGLISLLSCREVGEAYERLDSMAKKFGSTLSAPYMTLSFLALLVIPALKLSDKGLFDGRSFNFAKIFAEK